MTEKKELEKSTKLNNYIINHVKEHIILIYNAIIIGAGIVPVAIFNGSLFFLFGKECYDNKWGEFGGSSEKNEAKFATAIREGYEELDGFFGTEQQLKKKVTENLILSITDLEDKHESFVFKTDYDENLPFYFNNHHKFIQNKLPQNIIKSKNGLFEKSEIKWFGRDELIKQKKYFRNFYKPTVDYLINEYDYIYEKSNYLNNY